MKKEKKRPGAFAVIARRLIALTLAGWLLVMGVLTWGVATDMARQMEASTRDFADRIWPTTGEDALPGALERDMISDLMFPYALPGLDALWPFVLPGMPSSIGSNDWLWGKWDILYGYEAVLAFRKDGQTVIASGSYLDFAYQTEQQWLEGSGEMTGNAYIDLSAFEEGRALADQWIQMNPMGTLMNYYFFYIMRLTGYFEGNAFHPVRIDKLHTADVPAYLPNDLESYSQYDQRVGLDWENILDMEAPEGRELVTIYGFDANAYHYPVEDPVTVNGVTYDDLLALLESDNWYREKENLFESVYIWGTGHDTPEGEIVTVVAVRCWPLQYALLRMIPAYLVSFAAVAVILLLFLRSLRRNLTRPMEELTDKIRRNAYIKPSARWQEPRALEEYYESSRQAIHEADTRIAQLNAALEYAKNAEENRRQLVSNITHELKTPLAVIHSYAEGLQAGIAGEKREHYLNVILEESEKMDALVLQMLDLSRLEAGRVRLQAEPFSLLALIRGVVEKMAPLAHAKRIRVDYGLTQEFTVTADEGRIGQAVTNLVSNAIKYSPDGGIIRINVFSHMGQACLRIENTCPHLSGEALAKVFDSFYRADPSRSEPGTGLGLTIVKTIVELHRGSCSVRNTTVHDGDIRRTGVEFGFQIPE